MDSALPLDEIQIVRAAENMIREHGDEALTKIDAQVENSKSEGFDSFSRTWELIREALCDSNNTSLQIFAMNDVTFQSNTDIPNAEVAAGHGVILREGKHISPLLRGLLTLLEVPNFGSPDQ